MIKTDHIIFEFDFSLYIYRLNILIYYYIHQILKHISKFLTTIHIFILKIIVTIYINFNNIQNNSILFLEYYPWSVEKLHNMDENN